MKAKSSMGKGALWLGLLAGIGLAIGLVADATIKKATHMVPVYVAATKIPVDTKIQPGHLRKELRPEAGVPKDAIKDPAEAVGKYAGTTILPGQVIEKGAIANATTLRELVRQYGQDYVGMALQLDSQDMPIDQIRPGDLVAFLGTFQESGRSISTRLLASRVPVLAVNSSEKKIIVAVPRADAIALARDKAAGKISVVLDPREFIPGHTENPAPPVPGTAQQPADGSPKTPADSKPAGSQ